VRDILAAGQASHPELTVTVRKIVGDRHYDEDEKAGATSAKIKIKNHLALDPRQFRML